MRSRAKKGYSGRAGFPLPRGMERCGNLWRQRDQCPREFDPRVSSNSLWTTEGRGASLDRFHSDPMGGLVQIGW